jgi:hypothetical protein
MSDTTTPGTGGSRDLTGLIDGLVADLKPVRPLASPWLRALAWLALVLIMALVLARFADLAAFRTRMMSAPDIRWALAGSALTAALASVAALQTALPDRSRLWGLLPLPALALWIGASGLGCARSWLIPGTHDASLAESRDCLVFIIGLSIPLSAAMFFMLRRGYSFAPALTGGMAGLAVAAAAACLLNLFHPYDAAVSDLLVHAGAVALVVLACRFFASLALRHGPEMP